jgi:hypothetical protein
VTLSHRSMPLGSAVMQRPYAYRMSIASTKMPRVRGRDIAGQRIGVRQKCWLLPWDGRMVVAAGRWPPLTKGRRA